MKLAPIVLFTYKRLDTLKLVIPALKANDLAIDSELVIFSDAAKHPTDKPLVQNVRNYIKTIDGFKSVRIVEASKNKGLANSIIDGITSVIREYGKVIVLEDDLITGKDFLVFMNESLNRYEHLKEVLSISGYTPPVTIPLNYGYDVYFAGRSTSWGWATWADRWENVNWDISNYKSALNSVKRRYELFKVGSDIAPMLKKQYQGKIDSWAIRWVFHQFKHHLYAVYPVKQKIKNIGFGKDATHTSKERKGVEIDSMGMDTFNLPSEVILNKAILKSFYSNYSLINRMLNKFLK